MKAQSEIPTNPNIIVKNVTKDTIILNVHGETKEIRNDVAELKTLLEKHGDSLQIGEKIYNVGEIGSAEFKTIINQYNQESNRSYYLRIFLLIFVPVLALTLAYFYYQYQVLQRPLNLTVKLKNLTPNPELPSPIGTLTLTYGDKTEAINNVKDEALFKNIPANFNKKKVQLSFEGEGFVRKDTTFLLYEEVILLLPVSRDNSLGRITGIIRDSNGNPIDSVKISILDLFTYTDESGQFVLLIPFEKQRDKQRITVFKAGYEISDEETPVIPNESLRLILNEN